MIGDLGVATSVKWKKKDIFYCGEKVRLRYSSILKNESKSVNSKTEKTQGNVLYQAPEIYGDSTVNCLIDIYAFGITLLVLLGREESLLYPGFLEAKGLMKEITVAKYQMEIYKNYNNNLWIEAEKKKYPDFDNLNPNLQDVILRCLAPPNIRKGGAAKVEQTAQTYSKWNILKK